jgi:cytochrome c55X
MEHGPSRRNKRQSRRSIAGGHLTIAALLALAAWSAPPFAATPQELSPQRRAELIHMVRQDCGSCHGMHLTGGLGPALTPEALAGKSFDSLVWAVLKGRPGGAMPPWAAFFSEDESAWVVDQLMKGFPNEK